MTVPQVTLKKTYRVKHFTFDSGHELTIRHCRAQTMRRGTPSDDRRWIEFELAGSLIRQGVSRKIDFVEKAELEFRTSFSTALEELNEFGRAALSADEATVKVLPWLEIGYGTSTEKGATRETLLIIDHDFGSAKVRSKNADALWEIRDAICA